MYRWDNKKMTKNISKSKNNNKFIYFFTNVKKNENITQSQSLQITQPIYEQ